jgi:hypothetical protein
MHKTDHLLAVEEKQEERLLEAAEERGSLTSDLNENLLAAEERGP